MTKCGKSCTACGYILQRKEVKIDSNNTWKLNKKLACGTYNVINMLECQKDTCISRYIGTTGRQLKQRLADHRGYMLGKSKYKRRGGPSFPRAGRAAPRDFPMFFTQIKKISIGFQP